MTTIAGRLGPCPVSANAIFVMIHQTGARQPVLKSGGMRRMTGLAFRRMA